MSGFGNPGAPLGKWTRVPIPDPEPVVRIMSRNVMLPLIEQPTESDAQARVDEAQRHGWTT